MSSARLLAWIVLALAALAALAWNNMDLLGDSFWTVAVGRQILAARSMPDQELFTFASQPGPWIANMPGTQTLFALVDRYLGLRGLLGMGTAVLVLSLALLWLAHARTMLARLAVWPLLPFAVFVQRDDLCVRGQLFSDLWLAVSLTMVFGMRDGRGAHPAWGVLLGALWVNTHPSFAIGAVLPLALATGVVVTSPDSRPAARRLLAFAAFFGVGSFANPYLWRLPAEAFRLMQLPSTRALDLFSPPDFARPEVVAMLALGLGLAALALRRSTRTVGLPDAILLAGGLFGACVARRYGNVLLAVEIAVAGRLLSGLPAPERFVTWKWAAAPVALPLALAVLSFPRPQDPLQNVPAEAAAFIVEQNLPDNVVNLYHWGGYLDYAWSGKRKAFIDGRNYLFENGAFADHQKLWRLSPGWDQVLDAYDANTVLWESGGGLDIALARHPGWRQAYRNGIAVVYVRRTKAK